MCQDGPYWPQRPPKMDQRELPSGPPRSQNRWKTRSFKEWLIDHFCIVTGSASEGHHRPKDGQKLAPDGPTRGPSQPQAGPKRVTPADRKRTRGTYFGNWPFSTPRLPQDSNRPPRGPARGPKETSKERPRGYATIMSHHSRPTLQHRSAGPPQAARNVLRVTAADRVAGNNKWEYRAPFCVDGWKN